MLGVEILLERRTTCEYEKGEKRDDVLRPGTGKKNSTRSTLGNIG